MFKGTLTKALLCLALFSINVFSNNSSNIRDPKKTSCAFYLVPKSNTTFGEAVTDSLSIQELKDWLATNPDISEDLDLYAVGASFDKAEHKAMITEIQHLVDEHKKENPSFKNVNINSIRRLSSFLEDQRGIYALNADGTMEKISAYNPNDFRIDAQLRKKLDSEKRELMVVGAPIFGKQRKHLEESIGQVGNTEIKVKSGMLAAAQRAIKEPTEAIKHIAQNLRYFFPMREDLQKPTQGELAAMKKKLVIPGVLTFTVQAILGFPLAVVIPVTIVNAINSASTGAFRTFLANWFRRSKTFFPSSWLKQISLGTFFTVDLYWAGAGAAISNALSLAGWVNLFLQKWPSIIFNSVWRTPYHNLIYKWENIQNGSQTTVEGNEDTRKAAGSLEKFMSYIMTQFFIYSIITKDTLFSLAKTADGIYFKAGELIAHESLIMGFNVGHIAMLGVGTASVIMMMRPQLLGPAAKLALKIENWEDKIYGKVGRSLSGLTQACIEPFRKLFGHSSGP